MKKITTTIFLFASLFVQLFLCAEPPKNVIFFIGDGMGENHVRAARYYKGEPLSFESFECKRVIATHNSEGGVTDSAASATAMATGKKVPNGVVSRDLLDQEKDLPTILELFASSGKSTGILTTANLTDATPAAFAAHANSRGDTQQIKTSYFQNSRPNLLMGADGVSIRASEARAAGYHFISNATSLKAVMEEDFPADRHIYGGFGSYPWFEDEYLKFKFYDCMPLEIEKKHESMNVPHLKEMVSSSLHFLSKNEKGFFLLVEGALIDKASHIALALDLSEKTPNGLDVVLEEMLAFDSAVEVAKNWAEERPDTLIIVTSDHETGGLDSLVDSGKGKVPKHEWTALRKDKVYGSERLQKLMHTGQRVPLYVTGAQSERFKQMEDNTDFMDLICSDMYMDFESNF